jgi:hypothetical protein
MEQTEYQHSRFVSECRVIGHLNPEEIARLKDLWNDDSTKKVTRLMI